MCGKYKIYKRRKRKLKLGKRLKEFRENSFMERLFCKWNIPGKANNTRYSCNDYQMWLYNSHLLQRFEEIETWILPFSMICCQYCFMCLALKGKIRAIFNINVLTTEVFQTTYRTEQFNLLTRANSKAHERLRSKLLG